jgi:hypothetical protein
MTYGENTLSSRIFLNGTPITPKAGLLFVDIPISTVTSYKVP